MLKAVLQKSHDESFLEQGYFFALSFLQGWLVGRVVDKTWANLQPWSLGALAAGANLALYDEVQDNLNRHYLEPPKEGIIYHTFWGVTPTPTRIYVQYPVRTDIGSMLPIPRNVIGDVGYIDGRKSPFWGPYAPETEMFTIKDQYPAFMPFNAQADAIGNVMLNFDQRQYTYSIIKDRALIKSLLVGSQRVKKYTMGPVVSGMDIPNWLQRQIGDELLAYSKQVMEGKA
jgi:hypothetical protein